MDKNKYGRKSPPSTPLLPGSGYKKITPVRTDADTRIAEMSPRAQSLPAEILKTEAPLGFAVIVEGIVYGVYSSARESECIAGLLRASGLTCEIFRYE